MSRLIPRCLGAALVAVVSFTGAASAQGFGPIGPGCSGGCGPSGGSYRVCKHSHYRPPCYHAFVPFGYYETRWARWPMNYSPIPFPESAGPAVDPRPEIIPVPPKPAPEQLDKEPLPVPPRPLDDRTQVLEGTALPVLMPAGYPPSR